MKLSGVVSYYVTNKPFDRLNGFVFVDFELYSTDMKILSIESSADETAVSIVQVDGDFPDATYTLLGNALHSQAAMHAEYGGIYPTVAKREHAKAITPLLDIARTEADMREEEASSLDATLTEKLHELLHREPGMIDNLVSHLEQYAAPEIDLIAVTSGPGLEPALWVGVNFAKALSLAWGTPVVAVNHMEGHILASVFDVVEDDQLATVSFPALALLISGGHTELIKMDSWGNYEKIGQTKDDAVGEAYDKVARMLGLPYPGGPEIERLASEARQQELPAHTDLPRPMLHSGDLDMSFSGLKTAVRYAITDQELSDTDIQALARDFEDAATDVLIAKVRAALDQTGATTFIVGGGVSASQHLRRSFNAALLESNPDVEVYFPAPGMSTDNSIMIALTGHARAMNAGNTAATQLLVADGNRSLNNE